MLDFSLNRLKSVPENLTRLTQLQKFGLFAAFSHSLRNEGASTVRVLAQLTIHAPEMHLQAEDRLVALIKVRCKQLQQAAEQEAETAHRHL
jgi:hypothetical protein